MKRIACMFLAAVLLFVPFTQAFAAFDYESIPTPHILVVDGDNLSHVFYERAADERAFPASTTKIMTCILALESGDLDAQLTVGEEVTPFSNYSSLMGLKSGETVTLRELIYGLMLVSGNDAAAAIAVHVAGSIENFVQRMNDKAASLGMNATHFTNPHGVQDENHYTTARDMAKLMAYALQNETFCEIDATKSYDLPATNLNPAPRTLYTTNRLLRKQDADTMDVTYPYAVGGKTGDTDAAGKCLVAVAERDGARVIVVLFGDKVEMYGGDKELNNLSRFLNAKNIFEHVFENEFSAVTAADLGLTTAFAMPVENADPTDLPGGMLPVSADLTGIAIRADAGTVNNVRANAAALQTNIEASGPVVAPIAQGQAMGFVHYLYNGEILFSAPVIADRAVIAASGAAPQTQDGSSPFAPTSTPLIDRGKRDWTTADYLLLTLALLVVLLVALIVVFVITERKRRFERKRRRARMRTRR